MVILIFILTDFQKLVQERAENQVIKGTGIKLDYSAEHWYNISLVSTVHLPPLLELFTPELSQPLAGGMQPITQFLRCQGLTYSSIMAGTHSIYPRGMKSWVNSGQDSNPHSGSKAIGMHPNVLSINISDKHLVSYWITLSYIQTLGLNISAMENDRDTP